MLVLSREAGESVVIEDVVLTLVGISEEYVEASLVKLTGGRVTIATLPRNEYVEICYDVRVIYFNLKEGRVRLGFEAERGARIARREFLAE